MSGHHSHPLAAILKLTASVAVAQAGHRSETKRSQHVAEIRRLEIEAQREVNSFQREIILKEIAIRENLQQGRIDLVFESFRFMRDLIEEDHRSLIEERRELSREHLRMTDEVIAARFKKRISEIDVRVIDLRPRFESHGAGSRLRFG